MQPKRLTPLQSTMVAVSAAQLAHGQFVLVARETLASVDTDEPSVHMCWLH